MPSGPRHRRTFLATSAADLCLFASVYGPEFLVATDLRGVGGLGPLGAGLRLTPWTAVMALAMLWPARDRGVCVAPGRWAPALGPALHAAGLIWLAYLVPGGRSWLTWPMPLVLSGAGAGLALSRTWWATPGLMTLAGPARPARSGPAPVRARAVPLAGAAAGVALGAVVAGFGGLGGIGGLGGVGAAAGDDGLVRALCWAAALAVAAAVARLAVPVPRQCPVECPRCHPHPRAAAEPGTPARPMALTEPCSDPQGESRSLYAVPR
jgi:hypothetical protein